MVDHLATVATQSVQLWLRADEATLGWARPGTTMTGYVDGFDTWALDAAAPRVRGVAR